MREMTSAKRGLLAVIVLLWTAAISACDGKGAAEVSGTSTRTPDTLKSRAAGYVRYSTPVLDEHAQTVHRDPLDQPTPCAPGQTDEGPWQGAESVAWSPDGSVIVFKHPTMSGLFAASADGFRLREILGPMPRGSAGSDWLDHRVGPMSAISVSPDGTQLLYSTCQYPYGYHATLASDRPASMDRDQLLDAHQYDIARVALAGGEPQRVTTAEAYDNFPAWSPDGTRIAFLSNRHLEESERGRWGSHRALLYTMAPNGSDVRDLAPGLESVVNHPPQWAPDGQWLAFVGHERGGERALYTVRADQTQLRQLAPALQAPVSWSPDGQRLAFAQAEGNDIALMTIAADGSDLRRVATIDGWQPEYGDPEPVHTWIDVLAWSPSGDHLLFACGRSVCVSTTDGALVGASVPPEKGQGGVAAAWSPDGSRIAITGPGRFKYPGTLDPWSRLYHMAPDGTDVDVLVVDDRELGVLARRLVEDARAAAAAAALTTACTDGTFVPEPGANPGLVADCQVLMALWDDLIGPDGSFWYRELPMVEWSILRIEGDPPRVRAILLRKQGLAGVVPAALGELTELRMLDLRSNRLTGEIPDTLGNLKLLEVLNLDDNRLTGCVPPKLLEVRSNDLENLGLPECGAAT